MIKVLVNGCNGHMGQIVCNKVINDNELELVGGFDRTNDIKLDYPVYTNINSIDIQPDVIIDFSVPIATLNILEYCKKYNVPIVIATTGFNDDELNIINEYSKTIPIFKSANMSFDIQLMKKILMQISSLLRDTDVEIVETHHNRKIDSPSGTALLLADAINSSLDNSLNYVYDRHSNHKKREKNEIGFSSIRGGNIVGEHSVFFFGNNETLEIKHTTYSREVFADGAIKACKYLFDKNPGLYNMDNLV